MTGGSRGRGGGGAFSPDKIDSLGRLMTRILRHTASELNLKVRSDGYVKVQDLLELNLNTLANTPLKSHSINDVREAVVADKKQRFSLVEENGELFIRANQGHTLKAVKTESLLKPIVSAEEVSVCVHGTYRENLRSILEHGLKRMKRLHIHFACGLPEDSHVISGMRHNVDVVIFLDVKKALEEGMKLYFSENKVVLTEGFNGIVPVKYFEKIESRPEFSDDDGDDRNHKHRRRETQTHSPERDLGSVSTRPHRNQKKPFENGHSHRETASQSNEPWRNYDMPPLEKDFPGKFDRRRPGSTPVSRTPLDLNQRGRENQSWTGGDPGSGRGRGRELGSWGVRDSSFSSLDFNPTIAQQGYVPSSLFTGRVMSSVSNPQSASWSAFGLVPGLPNDGLR